MGKQEHDESFEKFKRMAYKRIAEGVGGLNRLDLQAEKFSSIGGVRCSGTIQWAPLECPALFEPSERFFHVWVKGNRTELLIENPTRKIIVIKSEGGSRHVQLIFDDGGENQNISPCTIELGYASEMDKACAPQHSTIVDAAAISKEPPVAVKADAREKPVVTFSENFKTVMCTTWKKSESRSRVRQATNILRRLFENWKNGNQPLSFAKLRPDREIDRLGKELNSQKYPQTFALIVIETHEITGNRTAHLSDDYEYKAT